MKKTRKTLYSILLCAAVCVCFVFCLTACQDEHEHTYGEWSIVTNATCTQAGEQKRSCSCGDTVTETIAALGHTEEIDAAVAPDCTNTGLTEGKHCSVCNEKIIAQTVVDALGHAYGTTTYVWSADNSTCTATRVCSNDNAHTESETATVASTITQNKSCTDDELIKHTATFTNFAFETQIKENVKTADKLGHTYGELVAKVDATCSATGFEAHYLCDVCDTYFTSEKVETTSAALTIAIDADAHAYGTPTYTWDFSAAPMVFCIAERKCTHSQTHVEVEANFDTGTVTQARSCTADQLTTYTVSFTNSAFETQVQENVITASAFGHSYDIPTYAWSNVDGTCTATRRCWNDATHIETETVTVTSEFTQEKSCTDDELTTYTATFTNSAFETQIKENVKTADKLGHSYGAWNNEVPATCTTDGTKGYQTCSRCNKNYDTNDVEITDLTISAPGHTFGDWFDEVPATCTTMGTRGYKCCSACRRAFNQSDIVLSDLILPAHGHNYGIPTYSWTIGYDYCTANRVCSYDETHIETESVSATSEITQQKSCLTDELTTYTATFTNSAFTTQIEENVKTDDKQRHIYTVWSAEVPATCTTDGIKGYKPCVNCNKKFDNDGVEITDLTISAFGHDYETKYNWNDDYSACTATRVCSNDNAHTESETATVASTVTQVQSCTDDELTKYTATFTNPAFETQIKENVKTANKLGHAYGELAAKVDATCLTTGFEAHYFCDVCDTYFTADKVTTTDTALTIAIDADAHNYGVPTYVWSADNSTCTATRVCSRNNTHTETENATVTSEITQAQSCTDDELTKYTATFTNPAFETQIKENVKTADMLGHSYQTGICSACKEKQPPSEGISYTLQNNTHYAVTGIGTCTDKSIVIPSTYLDKPVASIGNSAFIGCSALTSIVIPDSVTSIGGSAFSGCSALASIVIPDSVTAIGNSAFKGCSALTSIVIPDSVTSINSDVFSGCTLLATVTLGNNLEIIGDSAFDRCSALTHIVVPDTVTSIGSFAFTGCSALTSIAIPDSVTSIGNSVFKGCTLLETVTLGIKVETIGNVTFSGCAALTSIVIPDSVTSIGYDAFSGCSALTSIVIPSSVASIGEYAFYNCSALTSIVIPDSVTSISNSAFKGCASLETVTLGTIVETIGNYAFDGCSALTSIVIPDSVTFIGKYAFSNCALLETVTLGTKVEAIGNSAFSGCSALAGIIIPDSVTSIGNSAFYNCSALTDIIVPDSVTSISNYVFNGCASLETVTLGNKVETIGDYAFDSCSALTSIIIPDSVTSIGNSAFMDCTSLETVTLGNKVETIGYNTFKGCSALTSIVIPSSVTSISGASFSDCSALTSIVIPNSVTSISSNAFWNCTSLETVTLGNKVETIGNYAFNGCSALTSIVIPDSVTSIGNNAFFGCSALTSIVIPDSVTSIGNNAFDGCSALTSIVIPDSVTSIGYEAFFGCSALTSIVIPDSVTSIVSSTFNGCTLLATVTLGANVETIGTYAFNGCTSLAKITFSGTVEQWTAITKGTGWDKLTATYTVICTDGTLDKSGNILTSVGLSYTLSADGTYYIVSGIGTCTDTDIIIPSQYQGTSVTSIGDKAFWECSTLTSIVIPDSVVSIGDYAFISCTSLESVTLGNKLEIIGVSAFARCSALTSIDIPTTVVSIDKGAFGYCDSLESVTLGNKLETIGESAFSGCIKLTSIVIPNSVTSIGGYAFGYCDLLENVTFGDSVATIGVYAFVYCPLKSIVIPDSVTSISQGAFYGCSALTSITVPDSVISIEERAFETCSSLTVVSFSGTVEQWNAIDRAVDWDKNTADYTVICKDGTVDKDGNVVSQ